MRVAWIYVTPSYRGVLLGKWIQDQVVRLRNVFKYPPKFFPNKYEHFGVEATGIEIINQNQILIMATFPKRRKQQIVNMSSWQSFCKK